VGRKLHGREWERAVKECDRVIEAHASDEELKERALAVKALIPSFGRNYDDGDRKTRMGATESAVKPLLKAREVYQQIRLPGPLGGTLDDMLVGALGNQAKVALAKTDLVRAHDYYREVLKIRPDDADAQAGQDRIIQRAEKLIIEAYVIRERKPEDAAAKLRLVMEVAPVKSPTYQKAKEHLEAIGL
jgi:hypothetical protein